MLEIIQENYISIGQLEELLDSTKYDEYFVLGNLHDVSEIFKQRNISFQKYDDTTPQKFRNFLDMLVCEQSDIEENNSKRLIICNGCLSSADNLLERNLTYFRHIHFDMFLNVLSEIPTTYSNTTLISIE